MDTKNVIALAVLCTLFGATLGATMSQDQGSFKLHKTRSGTFIIDDRGGDKVPSKIYEVLELPTNKVSFQGD